VINSVGICLILSCGVKVVSPCYWRWRNNLNEPLDPFPLFGWLLNKKAARVEDISLAFLYWVVGRDSSPPLTFRL